MGTPLLAFAIAAVAAALLTPLLRAQAIRFDVLDHAVTARKIHGHPVPRLGGVAIVVAFYVALGGVWLLAPPVHLSDLAWGRALGALGGLSLIAVLGVVDDIRGTNAWQKFGVQILASGLLYACGFRIASIATPFGPTLDLGLAGLPLTLLWMVGITNALNLIDGLDGLAGGVALIALGVTFLIAVGRGEPLTLVIVAALAGAVLGFLRYNLHPASIFMGDTGSMFLGFALAALAIESQLKSTTAVAMLVPITALGLPILDTLLAIVRRAVGGRHVFHADREHIHHRLMAIGLTHRRAVLVLYGVSGFFGAVALALVHADQAATLVLFAMLGAAIYMLLWKLRYLGVDEAIAHPSPGRAERVHEIHRQLARHGAHDVWEAFRAVCRVIDADSVRLSLVEVGPEGEVVTRRYTAGPWAEDDEVFRVRFRLSGDGPDADWVEFRWEQGAPSLDPSTEEAVRLFCHDIGGAGAKRSPERFKVVSMRR